MDPTPIVDGIITVVQSNPKTAGLLALVPVLQMAAYLVAKTKLVNRGHSTWLSRGLNWFARWPGPKDG